MYTIIKDENEIGKALRALERCLKKLAAPRKRQWSFPGKGYRDVLTTYECAGQLTIGFFKDHGWNSRVPVLITNEKFVEGMSPMVEINIPRRGIDRNVSGCFARDDDGTL